MRAALGLAVLLTASTAHAYVGTFDPARQPYTGPRLVQVVDTAVAPVACISLALASGDHAGAALGLVAPMVACADATRPTCTIIAPISAGPGQLLAALGALASPDAVLGHEFRHCRDGDFHPPLLPMIERTT